MQCFIIFCRMVSNKMLTTLALTEKSFIELLKERKVLESALSKIWENTDGCADQYRFTSVLYLMSVISQCYSVIIDCDISAPGNGKEVFEGINVIDKGYIYQLMPNFQPLE